ncbi:hypothetical protein Pr1d_45040 [Bythopirellula goksoeyrii]|uniref:Uncharacterized protein n=1 Tax=Bythopirellula goksoeyrii TaxID=1400387 RepID=A0A5B9QTB3_9BACT|nr:hypothetical protein Pr1d_45040 [Bythopirellula goksoeyrii]
MVTQADLQHNKVLDEYQKPLGPSQNLTATTVKYLQFERAVKFLPYR